MITISYCTTLFTTHHTPHTRIYNHTIKHEPHNDIDFVRFIHSFIHSFNFSAVVLFKKRRR